jgi:hypothetical protein
LPATFRNLFLSQRFDETEFNQDICHVFSEAADLLRKYTLDIDILPSDLDYPASMLAHRKLVLEQMETELDRRIRQFQKALLIAKQICTDQLDRLALKYRTKLVELGHTHRGLEARLEETLRDARETFDVRMKSKVSPYVARRTELETDLGKLKTESLVTETTLKAQSPFVYTSTSFTLKAMIDCRRSPDPPSTLYTPNVGFIILALVTLLIASERSFHQSQ